MSEAREVIETWFRRVWKEEDPAAIDELFVPDGLARGLGAHVLVGPEGFKQFHSALLNLLSDVTISVDKSIESGDWISVVCTLSAADRRTGKPVGMTGAVLLRVEGGKIVEAYNHWDFLGLFAKLGLLPDGTFETALSGQKVA
jgi:ketosteroid isomerase-like protein